MINYAKGSVLPVDAGERGPAQMPIKWLVNTTEVSTGFGFAVDGNGHPDAIPPAIIAALYGGVFSYDISMDSDGVNSRFEGTFNAGESSTIINGVTEVLTGTQVTSVAQVTEFSAAEDSTFVKLYEYSTAFVNANNSDGVTYELMSLIWPSFGQGVIQIDFLTYYALIDKWALITPRGGTMTLTLSANNQIASGDDRRTARARFFTDDDQYDQFITICGAPAYAITEEGTTLNGSIDVVSWLPNFQ
jgi:hypothetical protein